MECKIDIDNRVREIIAENLGVKTSDFSDTDELTTDLGADSLDLVEMVMAVEEEYDIEMPDKDMADLKTVNEVMSYVRDKLSSKEE